MHLKIQFLQSAKELMKTFLLVMNCFQECIPLDMNMYQLTTTQSLSFDLCTFVNT